MTSATTQPARGTGGHHTEGHGLISAIDQMFFIPAYPFWSLMIIAVDVVARYGLCAYVRRANLAA
jgi:hypothetical protein